MPVDRGISFLPIYNVMTRLQKSGWSYMSKFELPDSPTVAEA